MATPSDPETEKRRRNQENILHGTPKINFDSPLDYATLSGRTAIITGGATGIGHGIAQALITHGARVAVLDLSWPPAGQTIPEGDDGDDDGDKIKFFRCDVSNWDSLLAAFKSVLVWSQNRLDIVIPSAGLRSHNIRDLLLQGHDEQGGGPVRPPSAVFDVNLVGTYYTAYLALWHFRHLAPPGASGGGGAADDGWRPQLLFLGSLAGYVDHPLSADYCASKHGVRGLWKSVRAHGGLFGGAQVNMLAPTFINNRQGSTKSRGAGLAASLAGEVRMGEVEDVVAGALRCVCDVEVDGRALCCVKGEEGFPGGNNFDLCDNVLDLNAGKTIVDSLNNGTLGYLGKQR